MSASNEMLTSQKFAARAGVSTSTVSKWLKIGKIKGVKQGGKWMITADQLTTAPAQVSIPLAPPVAIKPMPVSANISEPVLGQRTYSIEEFSAMSYLTTYGVERLLKEGRLTGVKNEAGKWSVDYANVERTDIQRLLRK